MNDRMTLSKADHREMKAMLKTLADSEEGKNAGDPEPAPHKRRAAKRPRQTANAR